MTNISININIADRTYPLTIKTEEEELVRKAAMMINNKVQDYSVQYAFKDKQDLLAMITLQFATSLLKLNNNAILSDNALKTLENIEKELTMALGY